MIAETTVYVSDGNAPPRPGPGTIAAAELGAAALALALAAFFARLRVRHGAAAAPRRRVRAMLAALAFAVAFMARDPLLSALLSYPRSGPVELALRAAFVWAGAALLFAFADAVLARLDARRDRGWLIAAPLIFGIIVLAPLRLMWVPEEAWPFTFIAFALNGAAGGLIWWSLLPPGPPRVARLFD